MTIYKKKGSCSGPSSDRPIFLLDVTTKLYASMVVGRLNKTVAARLAETQHGFWKGYSTEQAILAVPTIIRISLDRGHSGDLVFVDIKKAFDSVPHEALHNLILVLEVSKNVQRSIWQGYEEPKRTIKCTTQHSTFSSTSVYANIWCMNEKIMQNIRLLCGICTFFIEQILDEI